MYQLSDYPRERQEELMAAAEAWRRAYPSGRHSLRYRAGSRLLRLGRLLMGENGPEHR